MAEDEMTAMEDEMKRAEEQLRRRKEDQERAIQTPRRYTNNKCCNYNTHLELDFGFRIRMWIRD